MTQAHAFLIEEFSLEKHSLIPTESLNPALKQHLKALRIRNQEKVHFLDGKGNLARATCVSTQPYSFSIEETLFKEQKKPILHLYISPPRRDSLNQALSQAVEMGVTKITFLKTQHGDLSKKELPSLVERAQRLVKAALEQSQCLYLPTINPQVCELEHCLENRQGSLFFADENLSQKNQLGLTGDLPCKTESEWGLLIGPEGGWSASERELILAKDKVYALGLGEQILKVPTACVAALFYLQELRKK
jgi:16S rRNA (uracil1498-N3)-methyltransferase